MPAVPSLHPLTRTIAAGSSQKTVFYNNTRPQSKTDNVNGFMGRYTVQLMFSCKSASLHCLFLPLSSPSSSPSLPVSLALSLPPISFSSSLLFSSALRRSLSSYEKSIPAWVLTACLWWVCKILIIHCA